MATSTNVTIGEMAARIAVLDTHKTAAQQALNAIGEERNDLETQMLEKMESEGLRSVKTREQTDPVDMDQFDKQTLAVTAGVRWLVPLLEATLQSPVPAMTVYLRRELWISAPKGKEAAISALRASDAAPLVTETYNAMSASSWMRDLPRDDDDLPVFPAETDGGLGASERFSIRSKKGA